MITHQVFEYVAKLRELRSCLAQWQGPSTSVPGFIQSINELEKRYIDWFGRQYANQERGGLLTVAVVGDYNSGKSSLINALLDGEICPVDKSPTTSNVTTFVYGPKFQIEEELPDRSRREISHDDYKNRVRHPDGRNSEKEYSFRISVPSDVLRDIQLVDTPGFNNPKNEAVDNRRTAAAVASADALFVLMDISKGNITDQLLTQLDRLREARSIGREIPAFLLINQADKQASKSARAKIRESNRQKYQSRFRDVQLISALEIARNSNSVVEGKIESVIRYVKDAARCRIPLTCTMSGALQNQGNQQVYAFSVDGVSYNLPASFKEDLLDRTSLTEMLDSVKRDREALSLDRESREVDAFNRDWARSLKAIRSWTNDVEPRPTGAAPSTDRIDKKLEDTAASILQLTRSIFDSATEACCVQSKEVESGFIFDDDLYRIEVHRDLLEKATQTHANWNVINKHFNSLMDLVVKEFGSDPRLLSSSFANSGLSVALDGFNALRDEIAAAVPGSLGTVSWLPGGQGSIRAEWKDYQAGRDRTYKLLLELRPRHARLMAEQFQRAYVQPQFAILRDLMSRGAGRRSANKESTTQQIQRIRGLIDELLKGSS